MIITTGINARIGASRSILRLGGAASAFTITFIGLTDGEARPGETLGYSVPAGVTIVSQVWTTSLSTGGTDETFTVPVGAVGGTVTLTLTDSEGNVVSRIAPVEYADLGVSSAGGEVSITEAAGNITVTVTGGIYDGTYTTDIAGNTLTAALVETNRFVCIARPQISGSTGLGDTLTATNGLWLSDGDLADPAFTYQWQSDGTNIGSATALTYTIAEAVQGTDATIEVTASEGSDSVTAESLVTEIPAGDVWGAPVVNSVGDSSVNLSGGGNTPSAPTINSVSDGSANITAGT